MPLQPGRSEQRLCEGDQILFQRISSVALRTTIARTLSGASFRNFSARLADSSLLQWFCRLSRLDAVRIPGKSQLQLYQEMVNETELREVVNSLMDSAAQQDSPLELAAALDLETQFLDSTCIHLNIHYPTDWVLLRDAVRTLTKATMLIRNRDLKARMNRLSMEISKQVRRAGSRKARKKTLRAMKRQVKIAAGGRSPMRLMSFRTKTLGEARQRVGGLCHDFDKYTAAFDAAALFSGPSLCLHERNLWRPVVLPLRVANWSLTSLQQRLVKTGAG